MEQQMTIFDYINTDFKITKPIRLIELFAGIGSQAKALKNIGANFEHWRVVEWDKFAIKSYNAVHGTNFETSDITKVHASDLGIEDTKHYTYLMTYSFPCQDLSQAGDKRGMAKGSGTRSGLLWEVERILYECEELPQVLLMENVVQVHNKHNMVHFEEWIKSLENLGYSNYWKDLNAKDYGGIPQNRNRTFMVSILGDYTYEFPKPIPLEKRLKDFLEEDVDEKYYLSDKMKNYILDINDVQKGTKWEGRADNDVLNPNIAHTISVRGAGGHQRAGVSNFIIDDYDNEIKVKDLKEKLKGNTEKTEAYLMIKNATKKGYQGDGVDISSRMEYHRGTVQRGMIQTLDTQQTKGGSCMQSEERLTIRRLTAKECWRLQGFDDADFDRACMVNSSSQLYKQAGNSICVPVLERIFKQMM